MKLHTGPGGMEILSQQDIENIYAAALRLLDEGGAIVENQAMLDRFAQAGARRSEERRGGEDCRSRWWPDD